MGLWELHIHPERRELHFSFKQLHIESFNEYIERLNGPGFLNRMDATGNWLQVPSKEDFDAASGAVDEDAAAVAMLDEQDEWSFVVDISRNFFTEVNIKDILGALAQRVCHITQRISALPQVARESVLAARITGESESIASRMRSLCLTSNVLIKLPFFDGLVCPRLNDFLVNHNHLTSIVQEPVLLTLSKVAPNLTYFDCAHNRITSLEGIHELFGPESGLMR